MTFLELAKKRFSVRKFTDQPVEKEKLDKVLEAGNIAPTAKNLQPQRIYVLQSEEALKKAYALTPCCYGAKTVLLFTYDIDEEWTNPLEDMIHSGDQDVSIVATHIMLEAEEYEGSGSLRPARERGRGADDAHRLRRCRCSTHSKPHRKEAHRKDSALPVKHPEETETVPGDKGRFSVSL